MSTRVVIAEDEAIIRLDLKEILTDEGYEVVGETGRGDEVLDLVLAHRPDVAILDVKMPGADGISAARGIAASGVRVAVLILTAFSQRNLIEDARDAGVSAYLIKPFQRHELVSAIRKALARCREEWAIDEEPAADGDRAAEDKIETRRLVDAAKDLLMERFGLDEVDAFEFVRTTAMGTRSRMAEIARQVLEGTRAP
ncbi:MAG: response regulator [Actinomycetota bacterium]|nr:response regulator [Actinomycetota bacterium]